VKRVVLLLGFVFVFCLRACKSIKLGFQGHEESKTESGVDVLAIFCKTR
jgi:hypothetical protein